MFRVVQDKDTLDIVEQFRELNKRVAEKVWRATGIHPRTRVVGISREFSVDVSSGHVYVAPVESPDIAEGYLAHENGHRSVFPVSSAGSLAFISAIKAEAPDANEDDVKRVANIVADAFSDLVLFTRGMGRVLSKRIPDFLSKADASSLGMVFKMIVYKAIELATKKRSVSITKRELEDATKWVARSKGVDESVARKAFDLANKLVYMTMELVHDSVVDRLPEYLLNPLKQTHAPSLRYLVEIARELIEHGESEIQISGSEAMDIEPSKVDVTDIQSAIIIAMSGFGVNSIDSLRSALERVFSNKIRESVKKLLDKVTIVYSQNDIRSRRPGGFEKKKSQLWLHPRGEPDEDSILLEPRKLLWTVTYRVPRPRGKLSITPASVPEKLVIVQDESGSTTQYFHGSTIASVEAFVSLVVMAGLRYKGGAKTIDVIKFSDERDHVYSGRDPIEAGVTTLLPSRVAWMGTNLLGAVSYALTLTTRNTALVVVTDAVIDEGEAEKVGEMLRRELDSGRLGFTVFIVVNEEEVPAISIIRRHLSGKNSIVAHIRDADDLQQVSQEIVNHILRTYRTT